MPTAGVAPKTKGPLRCGWRRMGSGERGRSAGRLLASRTELGMDLRNWDRRGRDGCDRNRSEDRQRWYRGRARALGVRTGRIGQRVMVAGRKLMRMTMRVLVV